MPITPLGFETTLPVRFYDCDCTGKIRLSAILRALADAAGAHYEEKGFSHEWLWEHGMAFLLAGESIRVHRYPRAGETLTLFTWEEKVKGPRYFRNFELRDEKEELVLSASTVWLLANPFTRKILRPDSFDFSPDFHPERTVDTLPVGKFTKAEPVSLGERPVRFSDLDQNRHVNNASYAEIALDALSFEEASAEWTDFRINFHAEAVFGEVLALTREEGEAGEIVLRGLKEDGTICFECEFRG